MKYKAGDRVKLVDSYPTVCFKDWLGKVVTIDTAKNGFYTTLEIYSYFLTEDLIEGLVEEENPKWEHEFECPDGYQFKDENGNVINATKIVLEKKKKEYPKTYEECCEILDIPSFYKLRYYTYEHGYNEYTTLNRLCSLQDKLNILGKLLICRDAYWKIAGEEMGLGKPWEPDWKDNAQHKYYISTEWNEITTNFNSTTNKVLAFPTKEMRDDFYENFKEEIEICKELL